MDNLKYKQLIIQKYLSSDLFSKKEAQKLFMFRSRMAQFAKNFPNGTDNFECRICKKENTIDNEAHSLNCDLIINQIPNAANQKVEHLWGQNIKKMKEITNILIQIMDIRSILLTR